MKKILTMMLLVLAMCVLTGCNEDKERIDNAAERAIEIQDEAQDVIDDVNEDTKKLENDVEALEFE